MSERLENLVVKKRSFIWCGSGDCEMLRFAYFSYKSIVSVSNWTFLCLPNKVKPWWKDNEVH